MPEVRSCVKPNLFIVGAPKCGTSSMHAYLQAHPEIFMSTPKELHYFGRDLPQPRPTASLGEYLTYFSAIAPYERWVGESSPSYLYSRSAPSEIREFTPEARVIIMVRNPVDMIYSLHSQQLRQGTETILDFKEALKNEARSKAGDRTSVKLGFLSSQPYREAATYSSHVQRYLDVFDLDRIHVIVLEELQADPARVYGQVLEFLDVIPFEPAFGVANSNKVLRSVKLHRFIHQPPEVARWAANNLLPARTRRKLFNRVRALNMKSRPLPPMDPALAKQLRDQFAPEVHRLSKLLGRDLSFWL